MWLVRIIPIPLLCFFNKCSGSVYLIFIKKDIIEDFPARNLFTSSQFFVVHSKSCLGIRKAPFISYIVWLCLFCFQPPILQMIKVIPSSAFANCPHLSANSSFCHFPDKSFLPRLSPIALTYPQTAVFAIFRISHPFHGFRQLTSLIRKHRFLPFSG